MMRWRSRPKKAPIPFWDVKSRGRTRGEDPRAPWCRLDDNRISIDPNPSDPFSASNYTHKNEGKEEEEGGREGRREGRKQGGSYKALIECDFIQVEHIVGEFGWGGIECLILDEIEYQSLLTF